MTPLELAVKELAERRAVAARLAERVKYLQGEIDATELGKQLAEAQDSVKFMRAAETEAYDKVCKAAVQAFDGENRKVHPAVAIKIFTGVDYDEKTATAWAREHMPGMLVLDKVRFDDLAKAAALEFVTIEKLPKATVAKDLSPYLEAKDENS